MITRFKNLLAIMPLITGIALMNAPVWAQDVPESPTNEPVPEEPVPFDDNLTSAEVDQALMAEEAAGNSAGPSF